MRYLLLTILLCSTQLSFGQFQKVINQSVDIVDATKVEVNLEGNISYQEWEGMFLLVETKVVIENCNENIFRTFVKSGRYLIDANVNGDVLGKVVSSKLGQTVEEVHFKIYYPKGFKDSSGHLLVSTIEHEQIPGIN